MKTEIIAIIDRSGSMASIAADAIGGYNTFLADQQAVAGEGRMTLVLFDHEYQTLYQAALLAEAAPLTPATFVPRGSTALLDALGRTLSVEGARIAAEGWADKVIVVILTDGGENSSHEFTAEHVRVVIDQAQTVQGWAFVFLAANQDAFAVGAQYGINAAHTQNFVASAAGVQDAYTTLSSTTRSLRSTPE